MAKATNRGRPKKVVDLEALGIEDAPKTKGATFDIGDIFSAAVAKVAKQSEKSISDFDGGLRSALVGVPLGHFALEVMFSESVLGLGRVICLDGLQASCKSSLMWDLCRVMDRAGGAAQVIDTEQKATENLGQALIGYDHWPKIQFNSPENFEEALQLITHTVNGYAKATEKTGVKSVPVLIGLDSTNGATAASDSEKIDKEGTAQRSFPLNTLLASKYLPHITSKLSKLPITLVGVRHSRIVDLGQGIKTNEPKGANEWSFHAFATFYLEKEGADINLANGGGRNVRIHLKKGTGEGIRISVPMQWKDTIINGVESRRHIWFNWTRAAFNLFTAPEKCKVPTRIIKAFKDVLGPMSANAGKAICKPLGLTVAAPAEELHAALYHPDNAKILAQLRAAFNIRIGQEFVAGGNFDELKALQRSIILSRRSSDEELMDNTEDIDKALDQQFQTLNDDANESSAEIDGNDSDND